MRSLFAFMKKEMTEQIRLSRVPVLGILFILFGIMNPAVAKLTPWLLNMMADSLAESGMIITEVTVTALDSWVQFYKNIPMGLIAFVLIEGGIFTKEYSSGTLILSLTKGLARYKVVLCKGLVLITVWTLFYSVCFGITYLYNAFYWDNSVAESLIQSVILYWIFGLWIVSLMVFFSTVSQSSVGVLVGTGGVTFASYLVGAIPRAGDYLPTMLTDSNSLIYGVREPSDYLSALIITIVSGAAFFAMSIPVFNKKQL